MDNFIFPDWNNNIINISASLANYLGVDSGDYTQNEKINNAVKKEYKNVCFILLDGLGYNVMKKHLEENKLLRKNVVQTLTSTFPSTTTNATTTLISLSYPGEHNWLGWSLYFEEEKRCIDIFRNADSDTEEKVEGFSTNKILPKTNYFERFRKRKDISIYTVCPPYFEQQDDTHALCYTTMEEMFTNLDIALTIDCKKFIYCYSNNPDHTMHEYGVSSSQANDMINYLNDSIEKLLSNHSDTLIIVSADHGHIDCKGNIELFADEKLYTFLNHPLTLDARSVSFSVKKGMEKEFEEYFKKYEEYFTLFSVDYLLKNNVFGRYNEKTKKFLGDYIAVGKENDFVALMRKNYPIMNGHHTSLTEDEMIVPLIILENK